MTSHEALKIEIFEAMTEFALSFGENGSVTGLKQSQG